MANIRVSKLAKYDVNKKANPSSDNYKFSQTSAARNKELPLKKSIKKKFSDVFTQGSCGDSTSCVAIDCDLYYSQKQITPSLKFTYYNQLVSEDSKNKVKDIGSTVECGLDIVRKFGVCDSEVWSDDNGLDKKPKRSAYTSSLKNYTPLSYYRIQSLQQIKQAIVSGHPVAFAMSWCDTMKLDSKNILIDPSDEDLQKSDKGHAMIIVGYNDEKQLFEVRNSWGPKWGKDGYCYISYPTILKCIWWDDTYAVMK